MIMPWLSILDCQNIITLFKKPQLIDDKQLDDYTIVVPLFSSSKFLGSDTLAYLEKYKDKVMIVTSKDEAESFMNEIRKLGFRVEASTDNHLKVSRVLIPALRKTALQNVTTKYIAYLDADSIPNENFGKVCSILDRFGFDLASVKIVPKEDGLLAKLQKVEYEISMLSRYYRPWLTSGASIVARTDTMKEIMQSHSLFPYAEDVEIGILAKKLGKKTCHVGNFEVKTSVPTRLEPWLRQRMRWWSGMYALFVSPENITLSPLFYIYLIGVVIGLWFFKIPDFSRERWWWELSTKLWETFKYTIPSYWSYWVPLWQKTSEYLTPWELLPWIIAFHIPLLLMVNWKVRNRWMLVYPFYSLFQALVMPILGLTEYIRTAIKLHNFGRIKVKHNPFYGH